ncbi:histone deacetylase domain-containing protein [Pseudomassariella vexata]|uniref:Histone deacetylase domain-domain-containing protein n=1 Tax=Pseudomassariella vexata TaxID=1141098 RepID=A0A1Y2DH83_9PEZI|nr:histone deacetylase domain-containing protein [Pseudomassariella vexata]ORY58105.1 histone deacetylase domain-domain-containing protein [Pseudomassariella vexata]
MVSPGGAAAARPAHASSTNNAKGQRNSSGNGNGNDDDALLRSLNQLSISNSPSRTPSRAASRAASRPPSRALSRASSFSSRPPTNSLPSLDRLTIASPSPRSGPRSPAGRLSSNGMTPQSRSGTPTLLRKASMNSLHSNSGVTPSRAPSRRGSNLGSPASKSPLLEMEEEHRPRLTEASVANTYFKSELQILHSPESTKTADTIVILHDSCYGHRFSRRKTTKGNLATIVERPERIQASALGVALAYVRLGDRHCDGKIPIHPDLDPSSLSSIPFRIHKTDRKLSLNSSAVINVHGKEWMDELTLMCESAEHRIAKGENELKRPEIERSGGAETAQELHQGDLYLCAQSLAAFEGSLGALCEAVDAVFSPASPIKRAFAAVRPPGHHCSASHPQGFCWINNVQVGIMHGMLNHGVTHAAIIDFDLHHGDGSQAIAWAHNLRSNRQPKNAAAWKKTSIGYFSLHDINSYPCEYGDEQNVKNASLCIENAHGQNIWNVHLQEWSSEVEFWTLYQSKYSVLLDKTRTYLRRQSEKLRASGQVPKAAIFLSAGFDASEWEGVGMQRHVVNVPTEFYARLTRDVVKLASEEGLGVEGRVISALEGGYSDRALCSGVFSHLSGLAGNEPVLSREESPVPSALGREIARRISSVSGSRRNTISSSDGDKMRVPGFPYDPTWWSGQELDKLDATVDQPASEHKPLKYVPPPTYSTPTQSFTAKMVESAKARRSNSALNLGPRPIQSRVPTPPPPEVNWPTAVRELSKLLIPTERPVSSCTWDELKADVAKNRLSRQSLALPDAAETTETSTAPIRKSLRERKPVKAPSSVEVDDAPGRRKTVGGSSMLAVDKASARGIPSQAGPKQARPHSRRLSTSSNMSTITNGHNEAPYAFANAIARPETSQSIRPESSMSVRTQASTALNVRKVRPAPARKENAKTAPKPKKATKSMAIVDTQPPVPKMEPQQVARSVRESPAHSKKTSSPVHVPGPTHEVPSIVREPFSEAKSDVSKAPSGAKKIKINLVTKEMKQARQLAAKLEKSATPPLENNSFASTAPVAPVPPASNGSATDLTSPASIAPSIERPVAKVQPILAPQFQAPTSAATNGLTKHLAPADIKLPSSARQSPDLETPSFDNKHPTPPASSPALPAADPMDTELFVHYQPAGPQASPVRQTAPLQWLPANVAETPQQFKRGHQFTAKSAIPFAPGTVQETRSMTKEKTSTVNGPLQPVAEPKAIDVDMWEIPETPQ